MTSKSHFQPTLFCDSLNVFVGNEFVQCHILLQILHLRFYFLHWRFYCCIYLCGVFAVERVADAVSEVPPEEVALLPAPEERIMDLVLGKMPSTTNSISSVTK